MASVQPSSETARVADNLCRRLSLLAPFPPLEFPKTAVFFGQECTLERTIGDGAKHPFLLLAKPIRPGPVSFPLPIVGVNGAPALLEVDDVLFAYIDAVGGFEGNPTELFAGAGWPSGHSLDGIERVHAGGALFVIGTIKPKWLEPLATALGIPPELRVSGSVEFGGTCPVITLRTSVGAVAGIFEDATLELASSRGPSQLGFELALIGKVGRTALGTLLEFLGVGLDEVRLGVDVRTDLSVKALSLDVEIEPLPLLDGVLVLHQVTAGLSILDPTGARIAVAALRGQASFGSSEPLFTFRGSYPSGEFALALIPGTKLDLKSILGTIGLEPAARFLPTALTIGDAQITYCSTGSSSLDAEFHATCNWDLGPLKVKSLAFHLQRSHGGGYGAAFETTGRLGLIEFDLTATYGDRWTFAGVATTANTSIAALLQALAMDDSTIPIPSFLRHSTLERLAITWSETRTHFDCHLTIEGAALVVTVDRDKLATNYGGSLTLPGGETFKIAFSEKDQVEQFTASVDQLDLSAVTEWLGVDHGGLLPSVKVNHATITCAKRDGDSRGLMLSADLAGTLGVDVRIARITAGNQTATVGCFQLTSKIDVSKLPVAGPTLADHFSVDGVRIVAASGDEPTKKDVLKELNTPGQTALELGDADGLTLSLNLQLGGESHTLALGKPETTPAKTSTATKTTAPAAAPAAKPAVPAVLTAAPASPPSPTTWVDVHRSLGPLLLRRIGGRYADARLWLVLDVSLTLSSFELDLLGLAFGFKLQADPDLTVHLDGIGVSATTRAIEVSGGLILQGEDYAGQISIKTALWQLNALAAYATEEQSFFAYAVLASQIGGPPIFFVTGLAAGLGINRDLLIPEVQHLASFPLIKAAIDPKASPLSSPNIGDAMANMGSAIKVLPGENWLALGVKFTSFKLLDSFALLVVKFGHDTEIDLLGLTTLKVPPGSPKPIAYAEIALRASYRPDDGVLKIEGRLTPASFIFSSDCKLTGGFAFYSWLSGANAGDFVVTLGGYHPAFVPPTSYPIVPRLGASWQTGDLVVKGSYYFALTPHAVMGGGALEATWQSGDLKAWFTAYADFLLCWQPFHYVVDIGVSLGASYRVNLLFTSFTVSVSLSVDLHLEGPPFQGRATVHLYVCSFTIAFGTNDVAAMTPMQWDDFRQEFLPPSPAGDERNSELCGVRVSGGLLKDLTGGRQVPAGSSHPPAMDWVIRAEALELTTFSTIPCTEAVLMRVTETPLGPPGGASWGTFGVAPVGIAVGGLSSHHRIVLTRTDPPLDRDAEIDLEWTPVTANVPAAAWAGAVTDSQGNLPRPDASSINTAPRTTPGVLTGFTLRAKDNQAHELAAIDLDVLQRTKNPRVRRCAWSVHAVAPRGPYGQTIEALKEALTNTGDIRDQIATALAHAGLPVDADTIHVERLAKDAENVLLSSPVACTLGERASVT